MSAHIEPFRERLLEVGYTPGTVRGLLMVMGQLGRWMTVHEVAHDKLTNADISGFCRFLESRPARRVPRLRSTDPLVAYLRDVVLEPPSVEPVTPVEELLVGFRSWMIAERGLAVGTVLRYENTARRFLTERHNVAGDRFVIDLVAGDVTRFLVVECGRVSAGSAKGRVAELRALLRYPRAVRLAPSPNSPARSHPPSSPTPSASPPEPQPHGSPPAAATGPPTPRSAATRNGRLAATRSLARAEHSGSERRHVRC